MLLRRRAVWALALVAVACGEPASPSAAAARTASDPRLFLVPERVPALVGQPLRLRLAHGDLDGAAGVTAVRDVFNPLVARVGGTQHNDLEVDVAGGVAGVTHRFDEPGDAMVGFSTAPRLVAWSSGGATEEVLLTQHVKCLLFVARGGRDLPEPSAALSSRIGTRLEVVPMTDPLPLLPGHYLSLRVRFDGPGLPGAVVSVQRADAGADRAVREFEGTTDSVGTVLLPIRAPGRYLVSVVHEPDPGRVPRELHRGVLTFDVGAKR